MGLVAPNSPDIGAFERNLCSTSSWLSPFNGFGPDNFLVGNPEFHFEAYREWIDQRFAPRHYQNLKEKMDYPTLYALGSFIQALGQNPGLEAELKDLGTKAHVYVGTGLGSLHTTANLSVQLYKAQRRWDRFWSQPEHNSVLREHLATGAPESGGPPSPGSLQGEERETAEEVWEHYWAGRSPELHQYLEELAQIDGLRMEGQIGDRKAERYPGKRKTAREAEGKMGVARGSLERIRESDPEHPQRAGLADFDPRSYFGPRLRPGSGMLHVRSVFEAWNGCHPFGRSEDRRHRRDGPSAASAYRRRILQCAGRLL